MKVTLKHMELNNYKSFYDSKTLSQDFYHRTRICGKNREGKSTIANAYLEIMTGKEANGTTPDKIRPHDADGKEIDKIDVIREIALDIDGKPTTIRKITKQKWRKPHGQTEEVFDGNETKYEVDGFSMNQKQIAEFMAKIADADTLLMCSNAQVFLNILQKSTADARKTLEKTTGFDLEQFIIENNFSQIAEITKGHSIEDVMKKLRKQLSDEKKKVDEQNIRIKAEKERAIDGKEHPLELADLELEKGRLREQLADLDKQEQALNDSAKTYTDLSAAIANLKRQADEVKDKANEQNRTASASTENAIREVESSKRQKEHELRTAITDSEVAEIAIRQASTYLKQAQTEYNERISEQFDDYDLKQLQARQFDENSLTCPTCGQAFTADYIERARTRFEGDKQAAIERWERKRNDFEEQKKQSLELITKKGKTAKETLGEKRQNKADAEKRIATINKEIELLAVSLDKLTADLQSIPKEVDMSDNAEYQQLLKQIADKQAELSALDNGEGKRSEMRSQRNAIMGDISKADKEIGYISGFDEEKDKNIAKLTADLRVLAQAAADIEKQIDIISEFSRRKNEKLASLVNPHFRHCQISFLEYTAIEGNPVETCKIMCDGTDYFNLNGGDKKLCEIDLCRGLQEINSLCLPIWCDESDTIDDWRIPQDLEQQLILIEKARGELEVGEMG